MKAQYCFDALAQALGQCCNALGNIRPCWANASKQYWANMRLPGIVTIEECVHPLSISNVTEHTVLPVIDRIIGSDKGRFECVSILVHSPVI